jgi:hypothetical protein
VGANVGSIVGYTGSSTDAVEVFTLFSASASISVATLRIDAAIVPSFDVCEMSCETAL